MCGQMNVNDANVAATILFKPSQLWDYTGDVNRIGRTTRDIQTALISM